MAFAEVDFEMETTIEPEAEWLKERGAEPETASAPGTSPEGFRPASVGDPGEEPLDEKPPMRGLGRLMDVLRHPQTLFGPSSERGPDPDHEAVDWDTASSELRECFEFWKLSCTDVLFHLRLAADVLKDHGVKICRGEVHLTFLEHEDLLPNVSIELSIDAPGWQPHELNRDLDRRAIAFELPYDGFTFGFIDGEGGDEEPLPRRSSKAKARSVGE